MKRIVLFSLIIIGLVVAVGFITLYSEGKFSTIFDAISGATKSMKQDGNSLFHQTDVVSLKVGDLFISGEVEKEGAVSLNEFYKREVVIKESVFDMDSGIVFIGAYRYIGYSLFDLLHPFNQNKKNKEAFKPAIDLYVIIENELGESVSFSWSEIFHTNLPHQILIATEMAPIVPYRKEVDYRVSNNWKIVAANDLFSYRYLDNPSKITIHSFDKKNYEIHRRMKPLHSPNVNIVFESGRQFSLEPDTNTASYTRYYSSFYGMGMGFHSAPYFQGPMLTSVLRDSIDFFDENWIKNGLVCCAGIDGYRAIYSYSELFNRTDQVSPILAVAFDIMDGGYYRIFHPSEFYADRSVKSLKEMYFFKEK